MSTVSRRPSDFVKYLTYYGLTTNGGQMPITRYLSLAKGSAQIGALINALPVVVDTDSNLNAQGTVGKTQIGLIAKGQGDPEAYVKFMNFIWDNQEALENFPGTLKRVYEKYFKTSTARNALARMAADNYLGYCCIGFVGQYLRYAGVWKQYKGVDIDQWKYDYGGFTDPIKRADAVRPLNLMIWPRSAGGHVAIIDAVYSDGDSRKVKVDMCQSSTGGPQCNKGVTLTVNGEPLEGRTRFLLSGGKPAPPVILRGCYIIAKPDLRLGGGQVSQSGGKAASGSY